MSSSQKPPIGMPAEHRGYRSTREYRLRLLKSAWPYLVVSFLAFAVSVLAATDPDWALFAAGWAVAVVCIGFAWLNPQLWLVAPFGGLAAIVLIRWGTDGLGAGLGPLMLVPVTAVALYGSRRALASIIGLTALTGLAVHLASGRAELAETPAWRQDLIMLLLAVALGIAVHSLVSRLRAERLVSETRQAQLEKTAEITRAIATSARPAQALCRKAVALTAARGAALFRGDPGEPVLLAWDGAEPSSLEGHASGPVKRLLDEAAGDDTRTATVFRNDAPELSICRGSWDGFEPDLIVCIPARFGASVTGLLVLAGSGATDLADPAIPLDLLAAEASIAIRNQVLTERLERQALTDPLTGIANRRGWEQEVNRALNASDRHQRPVSLAILDLDGFKSYNDRFGHRAGDLLLTDSVSHWQKIIRGSDHLSRLGGDEFVAILPDTGLDEALTVVRRMCGDLGDGVRASAGVAGWDGSEPASDLLDRADRALYQAKSSAPGSVRAAESGSPADLS